MKKSLFITIILIFLNHFGSQSQTISDAYRYSDRRSTSSAASIGLSNAVGALGADFSAISINPAGIGVYRNSIFHLGFDVPFYTVESRLSNGESNNRNFKTTDATFNFANTVGAVFSIEQYNSPWKFVNIGIGLNKTADYNQSFYFSGKSQGSITDRFLELALDPTGNYPAGLNPNNLDNFEAGLAYETGAIFDPNLNDNKTEYTTDFIKFKNYPVKKDQLVNERGKASDLYFMVGGNYNDKLMFGVSIQMPFGNYRSRKTYKEGESSLNEYSPFKSLIFEDSLSTNFTGIQGSFGAIFKFNEHWRAGLSYRTPSYLWLRDEFHTSLSYTFENNNAEETYYSQSPDGTFKYNLRTPGSMTTSIAYVVKKGLISLDMDFTDYSKMKFNLSGQGSTTDDYAYESLLNEQIVNQYQPTASVRLGGELKFHGLKLRAGGAATSSPYKEDTNTNFSYSLGLGVKYKKSYFDFGFQQNSLKDSYAPYLTSSSDFDGNGTVDALTPVVKRNLKKSNILVSWVLKF